MSLNGWIASPDSFYSSGSQWRVLSCRRGSGQERIMDGIRVHCPLPIQ